MDLNRPTDRIAPTAGFIVLAHVLFASAAIMAGFFFIERNLGDPGGRIFCMINSGFPVPSHKRWILILNQLLPLTAIKLGVSLKSVLILHSISPTFLYYLFFLYNAFRLRNRLTSMSIVIALVFTVGMIYFQWPDLEKHLMVPLIITIHGILSDRRKIRFDRFVFMPLLLFLVISSHPMAVLPLIFLLALHWLQERKFPVFPIAVSIILSLLVFLNRDIYEQTLFSQLRVSGITHHEIFRTTLNSIGRLLMNNPLLWIMLTATLAAWFRKRILAGAGLLLGFSISYLAVVIFLVPTTQHEPYLIPLMPIILLTYLHTYRSSLVNMPLNAGLLTAVLFGIGMVQIIAQRHPVREKSELLRSIAHQTRNLEGWRFLGEDANLGIDRLGTNASYFYAESMMVSAIEGPQYAKSVVPAQVLRAYIIKLNEFFDPGHLAQYFQGNMEDVPDSLLADYADVYYGEAYTGSFKMWHSESLNPSYFDPVGTAHFQWLHQRGRNSTSQLRDEVKIRCDFPASLESGRNTVIPYTVTMENSVRLFAEPSNGVKLFCRWLDGSDTEVRRDSALLMFDVTDSWQQDMLTQTPSAPGLYRLEVDLTHWGSPLDVGEHSDVMIN